MEMVFLYGFGHDICQFVFCFIFKLEFTFNTVRKDRLLETGISQTVVFLPKPA